MSKLCNVRTLAGGHSEVGALGKFDILFSKTLCPQCMYTILEPSWGPLRSGGPRKYVEIFLSEICALNVYHFYSIPKEDICPRELSSIVIYIVEPR